MPNVKEEPQWKSIINISCIALLTKEYHSVKNIMHECKQPNPSKSKLDMNLAFSVSLYPSDTW